jgi:hypothetical protein
MHITLPTSHILHPDPSHTIYPLPLPTPIPQSVQGPWEQAHPCHSCELKVFSLNYAEEILKEGVWVTQWVMSPLEEPGEEETSSRGLDHCTKQAHQEGGCSGARTWCQSLAELCSMWFSWCVNTRSLGKPWGWAWMPQLCFPQAVYPQASCFTSLRLFPYYKLRLVIVPSLEGCFDRVNNVTHTKSSNPLHHACHVSWFSVVVICYHGLKKEKSPGFAISSRNKCRFCLCPCGVTFLRWWVKER